MKRLRILIKKSSVYKLKGVRATIYKVILKTQIISKNEKGI